MRYELERFNIQVKIIEPGGIRTSFIDRGTEWASHPNYADLVERVKQFSERLNDSLPAPEGVAKTIYRAATDRSHLPLMGELICSYMRFCPTGYGDL